MPAEGAESGRTGRRRCRRCARAASRRSTGRSSSRRIGGARRRACARAPRRRHDRRLRLRQAGRARRGRTARRCAHRAPPARPRTPPTSSSHCRPPVHRGAADGSRSSAVTAGGRGDHLVAANLLLLARARPTPTSTSTRGSGGAHASRHPPGPHPRGHPGELALPPRTPRRRGQRHHEGPEYPLDGETLRPGWSLGVWNVFAAPDARRLARAGVLLAVRPEVEA